MNLLSIDSSHLVVIGSSDVAERSRTAFEFFVQLFRHHGLHRNERVTVLGAIDQLIAVQLILASQNKKVNHGISLFTLICLAIFYFS